MNSFEKVKAIVTCIQAINPKTRLKPGLDKARVMELFQAINFDPPPILLETYQWHNGINKFDDSTDILTLENAVRQYRHFESYKYSSYPTVWKKSWFPIICTDLGGGLYLCLDLEDYSINSIYMEWRLYEKNAAHYDQYLDAWLYMFSNKFYIYYELSRGNYIDFNEEEWEKAMKLYGIHESY